MKRAGRRFSVTGLAGILCLLTPLLSLHAQEPPKRVDGRVLSFQKSSEQGKRNIIEGEERRLQDLLSRKRPHAPLPWEKRPAPKVPYADPIASLAPTDLSRFDTAFAALSARCHVAVFAEGQLLKPALGKVEREKLTNALAPNQNVPLSRTVEQIARAFDYQAFRPDENTFLLLKRYSDPSDLPFVPYDEAIAAFNQIKRVTSALDPHVVPSNQTNSPLYQLMEELRRDYGDDQFIKGVPIADLSPERQQFLYRYDLSAFLSFQQGSTQGSLTFLQSSQDPRSAFRRANLFTLPISIVFYEGPFLVTRQKEHFMQEYAMSHGFTM